MAHSEHLTVRELGLTDYDDALRRQLGFVERVRAQTSGDTLLLTEHRPVVTAGRASESRDVPADGVLEAKSIALRQASRGGQVTYHGPGQLVGYPIVDLRRLGRDLHAYVEGLESALIRALRALGVEGRSRTGLRGVWVDDRKIASIGVAVRRWISYHGFALNVDCDLTPFDLITPCGLPGVQMTSLADELAREIDPCRVKRAVVDALATQFGYDAVSGAPAGSGSDTSRTVRLQSQTP